MTFPPPQLILPTQWGQTEDSRHTREMWLNLKLAEMKHTPPRKAELSEHFEVLCQTQKEAKSPVREYTCRNLKTFRTEFSKVRGKDLGAQKAHSYLLLGTMTV